jgi:hypothetical protein
VADGGGAQPESARERGLPVVGGGGLGEWSGGEARALERRGRRGVGTGGRVNARAARWQRGRGKMGREKGGGPRRGVPRGKGVPWGLAPTSGPSVELADDVRRARVPTGQSGERGA